MLYQGVRPAESLVQHDARDMTAAPAIWHETLQLHVQIQEDACGRQGQAQERGGGYGARPICSTTSIVYTYDSSIVYMYDSSIVYTYDSL